MGTKAAANPEECSICGPDCVMKRGQAHDPTLLPYSGHSARCPKCGCAGASTMWRPPTSTYAPPRLARTEHMERKCETCAFRWAESTLDAGGAA